MARLVLCLTFLLVVTDMSALASDCPDKGRLMQRVLEIERSSGDNAGKIASFSTLLSYFKNCGEEKDSVYARIVHRLGDLYRLQGDFEKGIAFTREAVKVNKHSGGAVSKSFLTNSYYNLGIYHSLLSYPERSQEYFDSCIFVGKQYADKSHIVLMAYEQKSFIYFTSGEYQKSIDAASEGIIVARKNSDSAYHGILLQQMAQSQVLFGLEKEAEVNAKLAVEILREADITREYLASAFAIYARVMLVRGNPKAAIRFYNQSIEINRNEQNWLQCSRDYMDLGYLYDYTLRDSASAIRCYRDGIRALRQSPNPYQLAALYNNLGVVYWRNKDYKTALEFYQRGLNALPCNFSDTSISTNPSAKMIRLISNDHFVATLLENKGESLLASYKISSNKQYLTDALQAFRVADKVIDQMRWRQVHETSKLYWRERTRKMYENAIEVCYLLDDHNNAFFFLEKSRAVLLNDKLNELNASRLLSEEEALEERELRSSLYSLSNSLQQIIEPSAYRDEIEQKRYATQQKLEKYVRKLERKYPQYFLYKYDTTSYTLSDLRKTLRNENQTFIEYFTSDSVIYLLTVDPETSALHRVEFKEFREVVEEYVTLCSSPSLNRSYQRFAEVSHSLYKKLFQQLPVRTARVVISFDDYFIPFESFLKDSRNKTSFLLRDHIFLYAYSSAYLLRNEEHSFSDNSILAVAPISFDPQLNLPPLRGSERSLKKIESYFEQSFSMLKEAATKQSFMDKFPDYSIVHVYSHAIANYTEGEPQLYFHDQPIRLSDLQILSGVKTRMLVLSGCRTGIGKSIKGEGVLSLARGFAAAGIPSTITTLWSADDKVTYDIMERFYANMQRGMSSDEALQKAKIDFLDANDGEYELPYRWACSVALGKSIKINSSEVAQFSLVQIIFGSVVAISLGMLLFRKKISRSGAPK